MTGKWNYLPLTQEEQKIETALAQRYASCPPVSQLLVQRGVTSVEEADRFFNPRLKNLHDPYLMPDMGKAVERLNRAMGAKEKIMVYGDYDVDGTTAVALVYKYLSNFYSNIDYFIPTRYEEGYGISSEIIDDFAGQGVKLVIILDCGIKANEEIAHAREHGIDFIICDHHVPDEELPQAVAILNPKMPGSTYPCPHLSGCGVGFKFMQAFAQSNGIAQGELEGMLDLVAVSIAADIVPMVDENRVMAYYGLRRLNTNPNMGLRAIIRICNLTNREITISDVIFNKDWHKGIIGIVASRLTELYYKPAVVLTLVNGLATGSSRSVQGFDIYSAIDSTRDLLENFGGHTYAVGLSLKEENIPEFTRRFEQYVADNILPSQLSPQLEIDAFLTFSELTPEFLATLRRFNPFGPGNQKPVFCTRNVMDFGTSKLVGRQMEHIKLELVDDTSGKVINGIAFNKSELFDRIHAGGRFDICYTIEDSKHRGSGSINTIQLQIKEIHMKDVDKA